MADTTVDPAVGNSSGEWLDRNSGPVMVLPAVVILLVFAIFPLVISAYLSVSRFALAGGGFTLTFVGNYNFRRLLAGVQQYHLIGTFKPMGPVAWTVLAVFVGVTVAWLARFCLTGFRLVGLAGRLVAASLAVALLYAALGTSFSGGVEGTLLTTLLYVVVGVSAQFVLGLGLALICAQPIRGRNLFRLIFFMPLMVTPVGVAYMFRMLADMQKGPFAPLSHTFGISDWSWATQAWSARLMVLLGDSWQ